MEGLRMPSPMTMEVPSMVAKRRKTLANLQFSTLDLSREKPNLQGKEARRRGEQKSEGAEAERRGERIRFFLRSECGGLGWIEARRAGENKTLFFF